MMINEAIKLVDMLTVKIDAYENSAPEFTEFNQRIANTPNGVFLKVNVR